MQWKKYTAFMMPYLVKLVAIGALTIVPACLVGSLFVAGSLQMGANAPWTDLAFCFGFLVAVIILDRVVSSLKFLRVNKG